MGRGASAPEAFALDVDFAFAQNFPSLARHYPSEMRLIPMKSFSLASSLGALSLLVMGCSSAEHLLGESGTGGTSGGSDNSDSAGKASGGARDSAGASSGGSAAGAGEAGTGNGGSSGSGNSAGDSAAGGAVSIGGQSNVAGASGGGSGDAEASCLQSGGTVTTALCCNGTGSETAADFPAQCAIGGCGCAPTSSHKVKICVCPASDLCFDGHGCVKR
jgi:hypothetical protein